ncbi:MAG: DUF354 domain-containing protein [Candidatus Helarchaeota archaeon]|nr:DUF354 domain-containing protein [Candidatus Helarchaeota archaeon]
MYSKIINNNKKIWIDLDNSPHVPFFKPIIDELEKHGFSLLVTARNRFQVCELAERLNINYKSIGSHYGKNKFIKMFWLSSRAIQLAPTVIKEHPGLAVSHGSRSQLMLAKILRIPSVLIFDYEYTKAIPFAYPTWLIAPETVDKSVAIRNKKIPLFAYPGIKEDVYVPYFKADSNIINEIGLNAGNIIVTVRPPAIEAHYYKPESEKLFELAMDFLLEIANTQLVLLPRNDKQKAFIQKRWGKFTRNGKIIIPKHAVDGLNLIWHSHLVISGGGTMNREAAALGVPVYSIFRGKIGAVDHYLSKRNRLSLIENEDDLHTKIALVRRDRCSSPPNSNNAALQKIVSIIVDIMEGQPSPVIPTNRE